MIGPRLKLTAAWRLREAGGSGRDPIHLERQRHKRKGRKAEDDYYGPVWHSLFSASSQI
jgi:hypothetical protein